MDDSKVRMTLEDEARKRIKAQLKRLKQKKPLPERNFSKYRVTIELPNSSEYLCFEYDQMNWEAEKGYKHVHENGEIKINPSNQERFLLKAWSNCSSWDEFRDKLIIHNSESRKT